MLVDTTNRRRLISCALPAQVEACALLTLLAPGASGILTFGVKAGAAAGEKFIDACEFLSHLANISDAKTLVIHQASTTHRQLTEGELAQAGVSPDMVRLSMGIEDLDDILWDIDQALARAAR